MAGLDRERPASGPVVQGFSAAGFRVDGHVFASGALLMPDRAVGWEAPSLDMLAADDLAPLLALTPLPEFVILGTGASLRRPASGLIEALEGRGVGIEPMDSRAAARAWGVLRAEGRWIGAALLPLG